MVSNHKWTKVQQSENFVCEIEQEQSLLDKTYKMKIDF
jgi:hypothetical protein